MPLVKIKGQSIIHGKKRIAPGDRVEVDEETYEAIKDMSFVELLPEPEQEPEQKLEPEPEPDPEPKTRQTRSTSKK